MALHSGQAWPLPGPSPAFRSDDTDHPIVKARKSWPIHSLSYAFAPHPQMERLLRHSGEQKHGARGTRET